MISLEEYLQDPCGSLSIPLWKWRSMTVPPDMKILHDRDFSTDTGSGYTEERYFRLYHPLDSVITVKAGGFSIRTAEREDIPEIVKIINESYGDISVSVDQITAWTSARVYIPELWIIAEDPETGKAAGCAIAGLDSEAGEGILEWVQVLPDYRRHGIGRMLVTELLLRIQGKARFATVSGRCDNESNPEKLYRSCGFQGSDVWHIMRRTE